MRKSLGGFTIVELLIVIVVIAILASISIVAFNGIQDRARKTSLQSDLSSALKLTMLEKANSTTPTTLPSEVKVSNGNVLQLTSTSSEEVCINGYGSSGKITGSISSAGGHKAYLCSGALIGSPVGGSIPTVQQNTNLVSDFSTWQVRNGMSYNSSTGQICGTTVGDAISPIIRIDGAATAIFTVEAYATQPSPTNTPNSAGYYSSQYFQADGVTPAISSAGYSGNGNAQVLPMSAWTTHTWGTTTGSAVKYVRFIINSSPTNYTSNNCYRNPRVTIP